MLCKYKVVDWLVYTNKYKYKNEVHQIKWPQSVIICVLQSNSTTLESIHMVGFRWQWCNTFFTSRQVMGSNPGPSAFLWGACVLSWVLRLPIAIQALSNLTNGEIWTVPSSVCHSRRLFISLCAHFFFFLLKKSTFPLYLTSLDYFCTNLKGNLALWLRFRSGREEEKQRQ